jgi:uncharacterized protein YPO0396
MNDQLLEFSDDDTLAGYRLKRIELYNWGTFHNAVWTLPLNGENGLLTGEIGSGKSTLVDAVTTLLVPPGKVSYNKAAGAEFKERSLRSYVLGYYKSERSEGGFGAKPVALRDKNSYSVILGVFFNEGYNQEVTLAQVFWQRDPTGQPSRFYIISDSELSIAEHFSGFGTEISSLKKKLKELPHTEPPFDSFTGYGAAFRRRFGLQNEQALELFHQTVSMKAVGNLTAFVREHMLEAFDTESAISALIHHFEDLNRAHESVLKAKNQIERLTPLVGNLDQYIDLQKTIDRYRESRDLLSPYFATLKLALLETRIENLTASRNRETKRAGELKLRAAEIQKQKDEVLGAIYENGGNRLEELRSEIQRLEQEKEQRYARFENYNSLAKAAGLPPASNVEDFSSNISRLPALLTETEQEQSKVQNSETELQVALHSLKSEYDHLQEEIQSLKKRRNNIPRKQIAMRDRLCRELSLSEEQLPFAGELLKIADDQLPWEGAAERLLHNFALSLLVPAEYYQEISDWVDTSHLDGRLVYFRIIFQAGENYYPKSDSSSLVSKLEVKPDSVFSPWIKEELDHRFDFTCAENLDEFRKSGRAISRAGQVKGSKVRHEKDDRYLIDDRSRYVLGWTNTQKIKILEEQAADLASRMEAIAVKLTSIEKHIKDLSSRRDVLNQLSVYSDFPSLNWKSCAAGIADLQKDIKTFEASSDVLKALNEKKNALIMQLKGVQDELEGVQIEVAKLEERIDTAGSQKAEAEEIAAQTELGHEELKERMDPVKAELSTLPKLQLENSVKQEQLVREHLQRSIDNESKRLKTLHERIIRDMESYRKDYVTETREVDANIESGEEYRTMLNKLQGDALPRFQDRFKQLLNENTIREVASFQAKLLMEQRQIKERVEKINKSMAGIEYNKDRYIILLALNAGDAEIRQFRQDLKSCTEGSFSQDQQDSYSEDKFRQVKKIIDRFQGREGLAELDRRWRAKVCDVRNWFEFAASERWREDDTEYEHYTDSGGKSGGQKEKLAYTVLAASLAYQFGLEFGETRSRSFRFVVIDEAFGKGSEESARYGLELFKKMNLQVLIVTPLTKIHTIEPFVSNVGFVYNEAGQNSLLRCISIEQYFKEKKEAQD